MRCDSSISSNPYVVFSCSIPLFRLPLNIIPSYDTTPPPLRILMFCSYNNPTAQTFSHSHATVPSFDTTPPVWFLMLRSPATTPPPQPPSTPVSHSLHAIQSYFHSPHLLPTQGLGRFPRHSRAHVALANKQVRARSDEWRLDKARSIGGRDWRILGISK